MAQPSSSAKKAEFVVTKGAASSLLTVWFDHETLAFSPQDSNKVGVWHLWQTNNPSFYQVYSEAGYRIEFDRFASQDMQSVLDDLKQLISHGNFVDSHAINAKQFELASLESGLTVQQHMEQWSDYKTYDYADIGDNEADPMLGKLIQQGFIRAL
ncbi:hypothetical protein [Kangiella marina]